MAADDTIADTSGYRRLSALPANQNKSLVEYHVYADPGPIPYGLGWTVDLLSKQSLPKTLAALRGQARKPLRQEPGRRGAACCRPLGSGDRRPAPSAA